MTGLLVVALATLLPQQVAAGVRPPSPAAVLLRGRSLLEHRLPAFIEVRPGQYLPARTLERACVSASLRADTLLLFLPASQRCEQVNVREQVTLRQRLQRLAGQRSIEDPLVRLGERPFLAIAPPAPHSAAGPATACICPNMPPDGVVMCAAQTRTGGTPIATVEYLASDPDGDALTGTFYYQHDADPVQPGLPSPLQSMCTPLLGTLQCTIDGNAPAQAGNLHLMLTVGDGISMPDLQLTSLLQVVASSDRVFAGGFEDPATLSCRDQP